MPAPTRMSGDDQEAARLAAVAGVASARTSVLVATLGTPTGSIGQVGAFANAGSRAALTILDLLTAEANSDPSGLKAGSGESASDARVLASYAAAQQAEGPAATHVIV